MTSKRRQSVRGFSPPTQVATWVGRLAGDARKQEADSLQCSPV